MSAGEEVVVLMGGLRGAVGVSAKKEVAVGRSELKVRRKRNIKLRSKLKFIFKPTHIGHSACCSV